MGGRPHGLTRGDLLCVVAPGRGGRAAAPPSPSPGQGRAPAGCVEHGVCSSSRVLHSFLVKCVHGRAECMVSILPINRVIVRCGRVT